MVLPVYGGEGGRRVEARHGVSMINRLHEAW
jgi:hypothetical protein